MIIKRESRTGSNSLHTIYRPRKISEFLANTTNKKIIKNGLDNNTVSKCLLFTGPAGCGKTTMAVILATALNCEEGVSSEPCLVCDSCKSIINNNNMDVFSINVGQSGGKDAVDAIVRDLPTAPFSSRSKIVIFDECHKLTSAAQDLLLTVIETGYSHVFFLFVTNHPEKLSEAFISRCSVMHFNRLPEEPIRSLLINVCEFEGAEFKQEIIDHLVEEANGVPRDALVYLANVINEGSWTIDAAKEITGLLMDEDDPAIIELSRTLIKGEWKKSLELYKKLERLPAETVRIAVAGFFVGCLKRATTFPGGRKFSKILDVITVPIYESGKLGQHKFINYMFKTVDLINTSKK